MKVYVVISEFETYNSGREYNVNGVFKHREKALLKMEEILKRELSERDNSYEEINKTDYEVFVNYGEYDWLSVKVIESEVK